MQVWRRTLANAWKTCFSMGASVPREAPVTLPSSTTRFPRELVDEIFAYLIYDKPSLLACSLTCWSWYIAAVPHLHHTLVIYTHYCYTHYCYAPKELEWPTPLRKAGKLGLLPLVKRLRIKAAGYPFPQGQFSLADFGRFTLRHWLRLTNVQELCIESLDIPSFMSRVQHWFRNFLPTVRSLALKEPKGSCRRITFFIGLFQHLEDLKLLYGVADSKEEVEDDPTLVPLHVPPLRGRLTMTCFRRVGILRAMIDLFGGMRFRHLDLFNVDGTRLLLVACAKTLGSLRLHPTDPYGEVLSLDRSGSWLTVQRSTVTSSLQDFNLSRITSLRALELTASHIDAGLARDPTEIPILLAYVLSTITSPVFSEVIVHYEVYDLSGIEFPGIYLPPPRRNTYTRTTYEWHRLRFQTFRAMHRVKKFRLTMCVDVWDPVGECALGLLEGAIATEKAKGGFSDIFPEPLVIYNPRGSRSQTLEYRRPLNPWLRTREC